jgi:hypothetical protein
MAENGRFAPTLSQTMIERSSSWAAHGHLATAALAYLLVVAIIVVVFGFWAPYYGLYDQTDLPIIRRYAALLDRGLAPYAALRMEYPPLMVALIAAPAKVLRTISYEWRFTFEMFVLGGLAAVATSAASNATGTRKHVVAVAFAVAVLATGPLLGTRNDASVALVFAVFAYAAGRQRWTAAAAVCGIGFALKLTPAMLLPMGLLVGQNRVRQLGAFTACAAIPFLPFVDGGVERVFTYHLARPLQVESVLSTPLHVAHLAGILNASVGYAFGSDYLEAPGAAGIARASAAIALLGFGAVFAVGHRRKDEIRRDPNVVWLWMHCVILAFLCTSKVLSPQFVIWLLPTTSLIAAAFPVVALASLGVMLLTQIEFPMWYPDLIALRPAAVSILLARNALVCAAFGVALHQLWRGQARDGAIARSTGP